jgi:hypothetical protein
MPNVYDRIGTELQQSFERIVDESILLSSCFSIGDTDHPVAKQCSLLSLRTSSGSLAIFTTIRVGYELKGSSRGYD